jgi:sialate O-acetylesterase
VPAFYRHNPSRRRWFAKTLPVAVNGATETLFFRIILSAGTTIFVTQLLSMNSIACRFLKQHLPLLLLLFVPFCFLNAAVKLPYFFSDNMVLQQQTSAAIWGEAMPGATVRITTSWNRKTYTAQAGAAGKWNTHIATVAAGGPYEITVSDGTPLVLHNVLLGEVWLCSGQSNMEMPMKGFKDQPVINSNEAVFNAGNDNIRIYTVPRSVKLAPQDTSKQSAWKTADAEVVANFSAIGYYFARLLQDRLKVPVGIINISYGGSSAEAWMSEAALQPFAAIRLPTAADTEKANNRTPTTLYNGMLHPFAGFSIKGCIWYQGESNYDRPDQYLDLFPAMVKAWREEFKQGDFSFYYAQIAPYNYAQLPPYNSGGKFNSAWLRDAQRKAAVKISNSGMVVLLDAGEENSIHPANKEIAAKRFAYLALAQTYGLKGFGYNSPSFDSLKINGGIATLTFSNAPNGLSSFGKPLLLFEIAGADKIFRPARAVIYRGMVLVSSPEVKDPVAVRYAFKDFVSGDLFSTEGFPVSSFRTDEW